MRPNRSLEPSADRTWALWGKHMHTFLHSAGSARQLALLALLLSFPVTLCRGEAATQDQSTEYDRIVQLISDEDWKAASDAAATYLAKVGTSGDKGLQARLRYIIIYATAGAVSTGVFEFGVLDQRLKGFVGKSVTLPYRPVINGACPGGMNAICISDPDPTSFIVVAANKTSTTIHAFEYVKLRQAMDFAAHTGEWGSITGTLRKIAPNPNKSRAIVMRIYIDDATVAFSTRPLGCWRGAMKLIEIRPHRWGWKVFEVPGVEPVFSAKDHATGYVLNRASFCSGEIRMGRENESLRADKRYLMVKRILAVLPSLTTLMM
jgi:hypothetical protein